MDERFQANQDVLLTELGEGTGVLLHLGTKFYYTLNSTGVVVWKALETAATRGAIADKLSERFRIDAASAARDVEPVLAEMLAEGLISRAA